MDEEKHYTMWDAEERNRAHPDTFYIPSETERKTLRAGDFAKVIFDVSGYLAERMWVEITGLGDPANGVRYVGKLANEPSKIAAHDNSTAVNPLVVGMQVCFEPKHVIDTEHPCRSDS